MRTNRTQVLVIGGAIAGVLAALGMAFLGPRALHELSRLAPEVQTITLALVATLVAAAAGIAVWKLRLEAMVAKAHRGAMNLWVGTGSYAEVVIGQAKSMITCPSLTKKLGTSTAGFVGWSVGDGELSLARVQPRWWGFPGLAVLIAAGHRSMRSAIQAGKAERNWWHQQVLWYLRGKTVSLQQYFVGFGLTSLSRALIFRFSRERMAQVVVWWFTRTPETATAEGEATEELGGDGVFDDPEEEALMRALEQRLPPVEVASPGNGRPPEKLLNEEIVAVVGSGNGSSPHHGNEDAGADYGSEELAIEIDRSLTEQQGDSAGQEGVELLPGGEASLSEQKDPVLGVLIRQVKQHKQTAIFTDNGHGPQNIWRRTLAEIMSHASHQEVDSGNATSDLRGADTVERVDIRYLKKCPNFWAASEPRVLGGVPSVITLVEDLLMSDMSWLFSAFNKGMPWSRRKILLCIAAGNADYIAELGNGLQGALPGCTVKLIAYADRKARLAYVFFLAPLTKGELMRSCYKDAVAGLWDTPAGELRINTSANGVLVGS